MSLSATSPPRIVAEVVVDDGIDQDRLYQMTAKLRRRTFDFEVSEAQFAAMNWISKHLGAKAIVQVGLSSREHVHNAIFTNAALQKK